MENPPLVSVIVCAYNAEQYIDESISSIINQSYENLEIIVINDGSTDLTLSHLEKISKLDKRIKIISNKYSLGFINSLNIGLGCFSGKYIARMDADDIAKPSWIEKIVTYLEKNDHITAMGSYLEIIVEKECGIIGSQYKTGDIWKNPLIHNEICEAMLFYNPIHNNTMIMRANVYREHKLIFNKDYPYAEDYKFWSEVSRLGCLANYPEALVKYRLHGNQASSVHNHKQNEVAKKIKRENITYYLNKIGIDINVINSVSLLEIYHVDKSNKVL
ncbi:TPA: glycosyltransferase family 2 protein, partial [Haemophilus influenzae]